MEDVPSDTANGNIVNRSIGSIGSEVTYFLAETTIKMSSSVNALVPAPPSKPQKCFAPMC